MLYPQSTPTRTAVSLDGIWDFAVLERRADHDPELALHGGRPMPVPSAYNDIYEGREIRDHVGFVVYERSFFVQNALRLGRLFLRFGSVAHFAEVYLNGCLLDSHKGGFLPFALDITEAVLPGENRLTVRADNTVDHTTLPCGTLQRRAFPGMADKLYDFPNFDYFNYSGILRPVVLYALPQNYITDITVKGGADGDFCYSVETSGAGAVRAEILSPDGNVVWTGMGAEGDGKISNVLPWSPKCPALYTLRVCFAGDDGSTDEYDECFGFRSVEIRNCALYLNGERIYLKGFGKHEDVPVQGRGLNEAYNVKDLNLMHWMGANSFRTSHYPYSEEMMNLCDRMGVLVIDETPAVGMHTNFTATGMKVDVTAPTWETLKTATHHADVIRGMIARDKNHPSVILWSIANEPASEERGAYDYFKPLFALARSLDPQHRPVTFVAHGEATADTCFVAPLCDVLMLNRYYGWYLEEGNIPAAKALLAEELDRYHAMYPDKPIMLGEFGADAVAGLHDATPQMFSEEFQRDLIEAYCQVLDEKSYIFGEHVWNFADFATAESVKRVQGNKKGVFTRERKPKLAAWFLKERWKRR